MSRLSPLKAVTVAQKMAKYECQLTSFAKQSSDATFSPGDQDRGNADARKSARWRNPSGQWIRACSILTTRLMPLHHRSMTECQLSSIDMITTCDSIPE
jgi:hypothetical protein